jgi:hypothetical protein
MTHEIIADVEDAVYEAKSGLSDIRSGTVDELPGNIDDLEGRLESIIREIRYASDAVEEAAEIKDEFESFFSNESPSEVYDELSEWRDNSGDLDCYEISDAVDELERWRELGDVDEVTEKLEGVSDDLLLKVEDQAKTIEVLKELNDAQGIMIAKARANLNGVGKSEHELLKAELDIAKDNVEAYRKTVTEQGNTIEQLEKVQPVVAFDKPVVADWQVNLDKPVDDWPVDANGSPIPEGDA